MVSVSMKSGTMNMLFVAIFLNIFYVSFVESLAHINKQLSSFSKGMSFVLQKSLYICIYLPKVSIYLLKKEPD